MNNFWAEADSSAPFNMYKDKVHYDYILTAKMPIKFMIGNREAEYEDFEKANKHEGDYYFEKQVINLLKDEDWMQYPFDELGLGTQYGILENDLDTDLEIKVGISLNDAKEEVNENILKEDMESLLEGILDNLDSALVIDKDDVDRNVYMKVTGDPEKADIKIEHQENKQESLLIDIDKKLVTESKLILTNKESVYEVKLNDDGQIEKYLNNNLVESINFSKTSLTQFVKELFKEGYELQNSQGDVIDTDKAKQDIEKNIEQIDELQELQNELVDKVDQLTGVNESVQIDFPSTEFTQKVLTPNEMMITSFDNNLTDDQKVYILTKVDSLDAFKECLNQLCDLAEFNEDEPIISIDDYINNLNKGGIY